MNHQNKLLRQILALVLCAILALTPVIGALASTLDYLIELVTLDDNPTDKELEDAAWTAPDISMLADLAVKVDQIIATLTDDMTDYEKVKALHDYVVNNADYDYEAAYAMTPPGHYASDVLLDGCGVCQAYAHALDILLHVAGFNTEYNYGENHIWNLVEIDGRWYNIDATWDDNNDGDPYTHKGGTWNYAYFCITNEALIQTGTAHHECTDGHKYTEYTEMDECIKMDDRIPNHVVSTGYVYNYAYQEGELDERLNSAISEIQARLDKGETSIAVTMDPNIWNNTFELDEYGNLYSTEIPNYTAIAALRDHNWMQNGQRVYLDISYDSHSWTIQAKVAPRPVDGIKLSSAKLKMTEGEKVTVTPVITPADAANKAVKWYSNDEHVVTVSSAGVVTAVGAGKTTIRCVADSKAPDGSYVYADCKVTVKSCARQILLSDTSKTLKDGKSYTLGALVYPRTAKQDVTWESSDEKIATVNQNGRVTAKKPGKAVITCRATDGSGVKARCKITVTAVKVKSFSVVKSGSTRNLKGKTVTLKKGKSMTIKIAKLKPANASNQRVTFKSSNKKIASVSSSGVIKARKKGTVTITVQSKDKGYKITFKVKVK